MRHTGIFLTARGTKIMTRTSGPPKKMSERLDTLTLAIMTDGLCWDIVISRPRRDFSNRKRTTTSQVIHGVDPMWQERGFHSTVYGMHHTSCSLPQQCLNIPIPIYFWNGFVSIRSHVRKRLLFSSWEGWTEAARLRYSGQDFTGKIKSNIRLHIRWRIPLHNWVYGYIQIRCKSSRIQGKSVFPSFIGQPPLANLLLALRYISSIIPLHTFVSFTHLPS
jgi:hypothetical protein